MKQRIKGGSVLHSYESGPGSDPAAVPSSRESGSIAPRPGTPGEPATLAGSAPPPGPLTGGTRRGWPARPRHGGGRPGRGAPGSGPEVLYVPAPAPSGADRGAVHCRPRRSKARRIPAVSRSDSGLPAGSGCAARGAIRFRESHITDRYINELQGMCGCAPRRARHITHAPRWRPRPENQPAPMAPPAWNADLRSARAALRSAIHRFRRVPRSAMMFL